MAAVVRSSEAVLAALVRCSAAAIAAEVAALVRCSAAEVAALVRCSAAAMTAVICVRSSDVMAGCRSLYSEFSLNTWRVGDSKNLTRPASTDVDDGGAPSTGFGGGVPEIRYEPGSGEN